MGGWGPAPGEMSAALRGAEEPELVAAMAGLRAHNDGWDAHHAAIDPERRGPICALFPPAQRVPMHSAAVALALSMPCEKANERIARQIAEHGLLGTAAVVGMQEDVADAVRAVRELAAKHGGDPKRVLIICEDPQAAEHAVAMLRSDYEEITGETLEKEGLPSARPDAMALGAFPEGGFEESVTHPPTFLFGSAVEKAPDFATTDLPGERKVTPAVLQAIVEWLGGWAEPQLTIPAETI